jgi:ATP-dependent DNA helicase RecQ
MKVRIFTLRFNSMTEGFDDSAVAGFIADKDLLSVEDHFFVKDEIPYLTLVIRYRPTIQPVAAEEITKTQKQRDETWRDLLTENDWPLFETLRAWRKERSDQEGIPLYVICNNRQLAQIIKARPKTLAALGHIEGFGEKKLQKYGHDILALIAGEAPPTGESGNGKKTKH